MYVASNGVVQGAILYADSLRPESRDVIEALRAFGMEIHLLTGDNQRIASAVARQLDIPATTTHAEAFPEQKAAVVSALRAKGRRVAFVGDGINDSPAPALAYADVSVSFGGGSDVAREAAEVVLMENDLRGLLTAITTARQTMHLIRQNIGIVVLPNRAALLVAALFRLGPVTATSSITA
jgi:Cu2+-exporting ATPase